MYTSLVKYAKEQISGSGKIWPRCLIVGRLLASQSYYGIAMIKYAGVGVAMINDIPSVKEVADFVTKSNLKDGMAYAIEKFILN